VHIFDGILNSAKLVVLSCHPDRREGSPFMVLQRCFTSTLRLRSVEPLLSASTSFSTTILDWHFVILRLAEFALPPIGFFRPFQGRMFVAANRSSRSSTPTGLYTKLLCFVLYNPSTPLGLAFLLCRCNSVKIVRAKARLSFFIASPDL